MAKITRVLQKIFGSNAGVDERGVIGSLAAGSSATTTDPLVMQSLPNYLGGLNDMILGNNSPAIEDMNSLHFLASRQLAYLFQQGVSEWNTDTEYHIGSVVNEAGVLYRSKTNTNTGNPVTDIANWGRTGGSNTIIYTVGNTTYDKTINNPSLIKVTLVGGGAGGSGGPSGNFMKFGPGGGGGSTVIAYIDPNDIGNTENVLVGAGSSGVSNTTSSDGGLSRFGPSSSPHLVADGADGTNNFTGTFGSVVVGGFPRSGDIFTGVGTIIPGGPGGWGGANNSLSWAQAGGGGGTAFASPTPAEMYFRLSPSVQRSGGPGNFPGGGGSGIVADTTIAITGRDGADGTAIIQEFF